MGIRRLQHTDIAKFIHLQKRIFSETQNFMISSDDFQCVQSSDAAWSLRVERELSESDVVHLVYEDQQQLLGFLTFRIGQFERCRHRGELTMGVLKKCWRQGIGKELLTFVEAWALNEGILRIELSVLESNSRALHLYTSQGYQVEGRKRAAMKIGAKYVDGFWLATILEPMLESSTTKTSARTTC